MTELDQKNCCPSFLRRIGGMCCRRKKQRCSECWEEREADFESFNGASFHIRKEITKGENVGKRGLFLLKKFFFNGCPIRTFAKMK